MTEESSSDRTNKSENGWHATIQKKDWASLQRYLEQVTSSSSSPMPQSPASPLGPASSEHSINSTLRNGAATTATATSSTKRHSSSTDNRTTTASSIRADSTDTTGSGKIKRKSKLNWLFKKKNTEFSMDSSSNRNQLQHIMDASTNHSAISRNSQTNKEEHDTPPTPKQPQQQFLFDKDSLLTTNTEGRTPLQVALYSQETPDHMLRIILRAQPKAAAIPDTRGRLPLHFAVVRRRSRDIVAALLDAHPQAVQHKDQKGKTPAAYAVEGAKRQSNLQDAPKGFWATTPDNMEEDNVVECAKAQKWQQQQMEQWSMALWLLQKLSDPTPHHLLNAASTHSSSHKQAPKEIVWGGAEMPDESDKNDIYFDMSDSSQKPILLEAMIHAAPPDVVAHLISSCSRLLKSAAEADRDQLLSGSSSSRLPSLTTITASEPAHDPLRLQQQKQGISIGCSALYLAIFRQYPISVLKLLGSLLASSKQVRTVRDETGLGLVSAHYVTSCFEKNKLLEYVAAEDFMVTMEQCIVEGHLPEDDVVFLEWWEKLKYLIFFCANKDPDETPEDYLLHAALQNNDTPPNVIRLLLALFPASALQPDAHSAHPLHLFAMHLDYIPRNYESPYMHGLNVMEMLLSLDESAVFHNFRQRLPLHHAIAAGRTWTTIHPLISTYRSSLRIQDPLTKLYPCQMAAAYRNENPDDEMIRLLQLTRNQYSAVVWQGLSQKQQNHAVERIRQFESLKRLDTIFELLRRFPQCVHSALGDVNELHSRSDTLEKEIVQETDKKIAKTANKRNEDPTGPEMIAFHYLSWCYRKVNSRWHVVEENMKILETNIDVATEHGVLSKKSADFINWWEMLKLYFWHCYGAMDSEHMLGSSVPRDDEYLLHVAVSISTTPPDIIKVILGLFPHSASLSLPSSSILPLHLACNTTTYTPQYFEVSRSPSTTELILEAYPEAVYVESDDGMLPLHIAILAGKTMNELRPIIQQRHSLLSVRDPVSGLYAYQLMAMAKKHSRDFRLRLQTVASNRHAEAWGALSSERKRKEIGIVESEYQKKVFTSTFQLLRLKPSVMAKSLGLETENNEDVSEHSEDESILDSEESSSEEDAPRRKRFASMRLLSGHSTDDSSYGGGFASIDMMSTISNVSSRLSVRRNMAAALGDVYDDNSEDSDIWSEDVSFHDDGGKKLPRKQSKKKVAKKHFSEREASQQAVRKQKLKAKWQAPANFAANSNHSDCLSIPKIVESADTADDVSLLDGLTSRSKSGRVQRSAFQLEETEDTDEELLPRDPVGGGNSSGNEEQEAVQPNIPDEEESIDSAPHPGAAQPLASVEGEHGKTDFADDIVSDDESHDGSIQDEIVPNRPVIVPDEPIVFRLRRKTGSGPVRMKPGSKTLGGSQQNSSMDMDFLSILNASLPEGKMDYLSTLDVSSKSLPHGSDSLPNGLDLRYGGTRASTRASTASKTTRRLSFVQEFPSESEHTTTAVHHPTNEGGKLDNSITRNVISEELASSVSSNSGFMNLSQLRERTGQAFSESPKGRGDTSAVGTERPARGSRSSLALQMSPPQSSRTPSVPTSRRSGKLTLELGRRPSNYTGAQPNKLKSCLQCGDRNREVMMLPCNHLCLCRQCSEEEEIRSCPICFGPVTEKKVVE